MLISDFINLQNRMVIYFINNTCQFMKAQKVWTKIGEDYQAQSDILAENHNIREDSSKVQTTSTNDIWKKIRARFSKKSILIVILLVVIICLKIALGNLANIKEATANLSTLKQEIQYALKQDIQYYDQKIHDHQVKISSAPDNYKEISLNARKQIVQTVGDFKKIFWLQTDQILEVKDWPHFLVINNHIEATKGTSFQLRKINNLNAYDWLSENTINFIKQVHLRSIVEMPVFQLLRIAILYQHGGVSIRTPNILLMDKIDWINDLVSGKTSEATKKILKCNIPNPQVFMIHRHKDSEAVQYIDDIIIAKPKAKIFEMLLNDIGRIIQEGFWPYPQYNYTTVNPDTLIVSFPNIVQALFNVYNSKRINLCSEYHLESFHQSKGGFMVSIDKKNILSVMKNTQQTFEKQYGKVHMLRFNFNHIKNEIMTIILKRQAFLAGENSILQNKLILAEGNKWLTDPPRQHRKVHFCIVSLKPHDRNGAQVALKDKQTLLSKQSFHSWNLVHFVQNLSAVSTNINNRTVLVNASIYQGLNLQRAATKHCRNDSIIFLLDYDQTLSSDSDLQKLAQQFQPIGTFSAYFNIRVGSEVYKPSQDAWKVTQRSYGYIDKKGINDLANSLRAFSAQTYLLIPYFALCQTTTGRYYDREIPLRSMIQFYGNQTWCQNQENFYFYRRLEALIDIPTKKIISGITINGNNIKKVDTSRYEYEGKFITISMCVTVNRFLVERVDIKNLVVYNNGREEKGLQSRKGMPELIPRKIHQVWIKGEMPPFKKFLMNHIKQTHPDYQHFLWTEENLTRQNFPQSYDLMQTLMKFDLRSPFNKMSMLSDLIRHQAVYRHGGFYLDLNYMTFGDHALDKLLTYSFFTGSDEMPQCRADRNSGFFGASKQNPHIERLKNHRVLSSRNYFSRWANIEAGPGLFGHSLVGQQELDETVFIVDLEIQYPHYFKNQNKCIAPEETPTSELLLANSSKKYFANCSKIYSYAIGMDFFEESGGSWLNRRW